VLSPESDKLMKPVFLFLVLTAAVAAAAAQSPAHGARSLTKASASAAVPLPPGVPAVQSAVQELFTLRYQEIRIGSGALAEPGKMYKVHYTAWLSADGRKFDSSYDHPGPPVLDQNGKPLLGQDGKPKWGDPPPVGIPQDYGYVIPGWDQGFYGMRVGGKRRLLIPYQLAYGARGRPGPDANHPGIPPRSDLIYDIELVEVDELPPPPSPRKPLASPGFLGPAHRLPPSSGVEPLLRPGPAPASNSSPALTEAPGH
jgi:peptidylprolyl isomerase